MSLFNKGSGPRSQLTLLGDEEIIALVYSVYQEEGLYLSSPPLFSFVFLENHAYNDSTTDLTFLFSAYMFE